MWLHDCPLLRLTTLRADVRVNRYVSCVSGPAASLADAGRRVTALEAELCAKAGALKSIQSEMVQSKTELAAKELGLQKARHELSMAHTRVAQESERVKTGTTTLSYHCDANVFGKILLTFLKITNMFHNLLLSAPFEMSELE